MSGWYPCERLREAKQPWLFLVPLKGGRWHIIPQLAVYTTYILPSGGLYATYHLLEEPETTSETSVSENHPNLPLSVGSFPGKDGKSVDFGELSSVQNPYDFTLIILVDS